MRDVYEETFGEAVAEYNKKQVEKKHPERQIADYLQKIRDDKRGQKPAYEFVVGVGGVDDEGVRHDLDSDERYTNIYTDWIEQFKSKYGKQFEIAQAIIHFDEPNGTPHMHVEVVPVAESKRGVSLQNSLNKAVEQCGAANDNKFNDFVSMMDDWRDVTLRDAMLKYGVEKIPGKGEKHGHIDSRYCTKQKQAERELDAKIEDKQQQLEDVSGVLEKQSEVAHEYKSINTELAVSIDEQYDKLDTVAQEAAKAEKRKDKAIKEADEAEQRADEQERRADSAAKRADSAQAITSQAEQRLKATQVENEKLLRENRELKRELTDNKRLLQETIDNIETSKTMVDAFDHLRTTLKETGTMSKFTDEDRAAFEAHEAARNKYPWEDLLERAKQFLRRFKQLEALKEASRVKTNTGGVDFSRSEQNGIGFGC